MLTRTPFFASRAALCGIPSQASTLYPHHCAKVATAMRSEEHTSELQSLTNLVCRLLLEKKKKKSITPMRYEETAFKIMHVMDLIEKYNLIVKQYYGVTLDKKLGKLDLCEIWTETYDDA